MRYILERIEAGDIPCAAWVVATKEGSISEGAAGDAVVTPERVPASAETIFDLASLTKPLVTSFLYLLLRRRLGLNEATPAHKVVPEIDRLDKRDITIGHLLTHTSGLPAWVPFYLGGASMREYLLQLRELPPEHRPGTRVVYSCAGYILLGEILHRSATCPLDRLMEQEIAGKLGLHSTMFNPSRNLMPRVAATEDSCQYERRLAGPRAKGYSGFRTGVIRGEVHDQNAWVLGGVAGNAGLFSTARETAAIGMEYIGAGRGLLDGNAIRLAQEDLTPGLNEARSIAFRIASVGETAAGPDLPATAFGHNGFTGTSVWVDPPRARVHVLLTNRVHPRASDAVDMPALRRGFHSAASRV